MLTYLQKYSRMGRLGIAFALLTLCPGCAFEAHSVGLGGALDGHGGAGGAGGAGAASAGAGGAGGEVGAGGAGGGVGVEFPPCTPATERTDCPGTSCDPATMRCSLFKLASRPACWTCVSDNDCEEPDHRCVEMYFQGERFPDENHGFCLQVALVEGVPLEVELDDGVYELDDVAESNCAPHLRTVLVRRRSLSGAPTRSYCGLREDMTTCFALRAFEDLQPCPGGTDEECPDGGICRTFAHQGGIFNRCTYVCTADRQCPTFQGSTTQCGGYCGG